MGNDIRYDFNGKKRFVNPYNFVSDNNITIRNNVNGENTQKDSPLYSGVLECELKAITPIAIPDAETMSVDGSGHKTYKFFKYDDKYAIPGSTIRGMLRSVYETITQSCFSTTKVNQIITKRDTSVAKPGVLIKDENGKWNLYAATRYYYYVGKYDDGNQKLRALKNIGYGKKVYVKAKEETIGKTEFTRQVIEEYKLERDDDHKIEGYLYIGEKIYNKKYASVFVLNEDEDPLVKDVISLEIIDIIYDTYNDKSINKSALKKEFYEGYKKAKKDGNIPIWYIEKEENENGKDYILSLASIGRRALKKRMGDVLREKRPCSDDKLCKACALFGMVSNDKSKGSRIRVTDGICNCEVDKVELTLKELSSPKMTYYPFYTNGNEYDDDACIINGRKFYWHNKKINKELVKSIGSRPNNMNTTNEILMPECKFDFKIYYDGITKEELQKLIWTITLGDNESDDVCHKIGHGKPLGLGSIKIRVNKMVDRNAYIDGKGEDDELNLFLNQVGEIDVDHSIKEQLLKVCNTDINKEMFIRYPYVDCANRNEFNTNDIAAHRWFTQNSTGGKINNGSVNVRMLPKILDMDISLPVIKVSKNING